MKKEYEKPKAEKVEFNYSETVVASRCRHGHTIYEWDDKNCGSYTDEDSFTQSDN